MESGQTLFIDGALHGGNRAIGVCVSQPLPSMSESCQALCFMAGANSIFTGDKLLTTANAGDNADAALFTKLGVVPMQAEVKVELEAAE